MSDAREQTKPRPWQHEALPGKAGKVMNGTRLSTLEEARAAKPKVAVLWPNLPLASVGITRIGEGYGLKVNLKRSVPANQLPTHVDGVAVVTEVTGETRPL
jgi:hypothetical protein